MRTAARRDANEDVIDAALRSLGWKTQMLSSRAIPDRFCWTGWRFILVEIKDGSRPASERKLTKTQKEWHDEWVPTGAPIYVVTCVADVEALGRHEARIEAAQGGRPVP